MFVKEVVKTPELYYMIGTTETLGRYLSLTSSNIFATICYFDLCPLLFALSHLGPQSCFCQIFSKSVGKSSKLFPHFSRNVISEIVDITKFHNNVECVYQILSRIVEKYYLYVSNNKKHPYIRTYGTYESK